MSNVVFPSLTSLPGRTWNISREPRFATKIQQAVGGIEIAAAFQPYPIWGWTLEYSFLRTYGAFTEWDLLAGFFLARQGSFDTFLYDDAEDDSVTAQLIGIGDGSNKNFQMARALGGFIEPIYNFNVSVNPVNIYLNGTPQVSGYALNNNSTGILSFTTAPANGVNVTWTGNYYWRCRFEQDSSQFGMFASGFWDNKKVSFRSVLGA